MNLYRTLVAAMPLAIAFGIRGQVPAIITQPSNQIAHVSSSVTFTVAASGMTPPAYQWRSEAGDLGGRTNSSLVLTQLTFAHSGGYSVVITNTAGTITSRVARLLVLPRDVIRVGNRELRFGTPTSISNLNTAYFDGGPTITADGLTLVFVSDRPGGSGALDLWMTRRASTSAAWGSPANLGPQVNSTAFDAGPCISPDGLSLYFDSTRADGLGSGDVWISTRANISNAFGLAALVGPPVSSSSADGLPSITGDGLNLFFTSSRTGGFGGRDLWMVSRPRMGAAWTNAQNLGAVVNTSVDDWSPGISADGLLLFFESPRVGGYGLTDLWVTGRTNLSSAFGPPVNLGPTINTSFDEAKAAISPDGSTLYFMRWNGTSYSPGGVPNFDLWQVSITKLPRLRAARPNTAPFELELSGHDGVNYSVEASEDLSVWIPWLMTNTGGTLLLADPWSTNFSRRYYRVVSP
jgi:hypothetical protein